jgi:hypothetical protein
MERFHLASWLCRNAPASPLAGDAERSQEMKILDGSFLRPAALQIFRRFRRRVDGFRRPNGRWQILSSEDPDIRRRILFAGPKGNLTSGNRKFVGGCAFFFGRAREESPEISNLDRIAAAAARRQKVPLKNRGVRQFARRCRRNVRTFAEDPKHPLEIQNVS